VTPDFSEKMELTGWPEWLSRFEPRRGLANGHLQTIVGNFLPRPPFLLASTAETVEVDPADGSQVLCHCHWHEGQAGDRPADGRAGPRAEGSSDSQYIQGIAMRAWAAGCNVIRDEHAQLRDRRLLRPTLYHSGLSGDVGAVVRHFAERAA